VIRSDRRAMTILTSVTSLTAAALASLHPRSLRYRYVVTSFRTLVINSPRRYKHGGIRTLSSLSESTLSPSPYSGRGFHARVPVNMPRTAETAGFKFNHTMIRVKDPKKSLHFYTEVCARHTAPVEDRYSPAVLIYDTDKEHNRSSAWTFSQRPRRTGLPCTSLALITERLP
jgi:hypothetical protein